MTGTGIPNSCWAAIDERSVSNENFQRNAPLVNKNTLCRSFLESHIKKLLPHLRFELYLIDDSDSTEFFHTVMITHGVI